MRCSAEVLIVASDRKVSTAVSDYNSNVVQRRGANGRQQLQCAVGAVSTAVNSTVSSTVISRYEDR